MTKLRILLFAVFLILVAVLIVFPYRSKAPIRIAFMGNLSGNGSKTDIAACNGAMLAVDAVNGKGGVKGRRLKLSLYDFKGHRENVPVACRAMGDKKNSLLIAPFVPESDLSPCRETGQTLIIRAGSGTAESGRTPLQITLNFRAQEYGRAMADLAVKGAGTMAVIYDRMYYPHGLVFLKGFSNRYLARGGRIKAELGFESEAESAFDSLSDHVAGFQPLGLMVIASPKKAGQLCAVIRKKLPGINLYGPPWAMTEELAKAGNGHINGMTGYLRPQPVVRSGLLDNFFTAYHRTYKRRASLSALFGYESVLILTEGIRNSASADPALLAHTLSKLNRFKGMISDYYLLHQDRDPLVLGEVRDGKIFRPE